MTKAAKEIRSQVEQLSQDDRAELALFLLRSLEAEEPGATAAWDTEVARRMSEIRTGRAAGRPAEQVFADLRKQFP